MMRVGIEHINLYGGSSYIDVHELFRHRGLDPVRLENLMLGKKAVGLPCEDPVTNGVNAAKPILEKLSEQEINQIEMLITASESGIDFGKSISTYIHDYLGLSRNCRLFEVKQACYGGTAALQMAANFVMANPVGDAKVLVIATDVAKGAERHSYAEPTQATGAVAMLISSNPEIIELDFGANGYYSYEVMDTCRPLTDQEEGDPDLSLLSYLECLEKSYTHYEEKVEGADFRETFDYLVFHTPFPGMVKGAHRKMMRSRYGTNLVDIEHDFNQRVSPSLMYCKEVGNVYSATVFFALCGLIDHADVEGDRRVGIFSYGSGCSSEFYSGVISNRSQDKLKSLNIHTQLQKRYRLNLVEYENIMALNQEWMFGIRDKDVDFSIFKEPYIHFYEGQNKLILKRISKFHREYSWS